MMGGPLSVLRGFVRQWLTPRLADIFFLALFLALFAQPSGLTSLLVDGDTGWHIRAGELVLRTGHAPTVDSFSFTLPGHPWFAWEWLSDVLFALLFRWHGLAAVASLAGVVLALGCAVLLAQLLRAGFGLWIALAATLAAASASSIHYLARPHVFSILLYTVTLSLLADDRRRASRRIWMLVPLTALWANLHGAFGMLPATLALAAICAPAGRRWRYGAVAMAAAAATLANPYGWRLHQHIWQYLNASWIMEHVQEFQSPSIRSEGTLVFAVLLLGAAAVATRVDRFQAALVLVWGFASMRSARHIPFFAIAAAPVVAAAAATAWRRYSERRTAKSPDRILWDLGQEMGARRPIGVWLPVLASMALLLAARSSAQFPASLFPARAVDRNIAWLSPVAERPRVLTSDQWADYLIFRFYPHSRVFFDGRSDFYGPAIGSDYRKLLAAEAGWRELLDRYQFSVALLPHDWALSTMLDREPGWRLVYHDSVAVLYARQGSTP